MAVTLDAKNQVGGGVTLYSDNVQLITNPLTLLGEGVSLTPANAAILGNSATILLSNATVTSISSVGTVVGDFSVSNGSTRTYTFSLTAGTSLFSVTNSTLAVAAALSQGLVPITAQASDTGTSLITGSFLITIISTAVGATGSLAFNNVNNSMYIPMLGGIG